MKFNRVFKKLDHLTCSGISRLKPIEVNGLRHNSQFTTSGEGIQNNRALGDKFLKFGMMLGMGSVFSKFIANKMDVTSMEVKFKMAAKTNGKTNKCNISARFSSKILYNTTFCMV